MIKIELQKKQIIELENYRYQASSADSEKALMVLLNAEGKTVFEIASLLKRNPHTVRDWLKRYKKNGINGLSRNYSPGRPSNIRKIVKGHIVKILSHPPEYYGYLDSAWSVPLIMHDLKARPKISASKDTVQRALKDLGYSYKRPSKKTPDDATPSKEEKVSSINQIIEQIKKLASQKDCDIYALDESHFSTEPYLVRGWFLKRWPPSDRDATKKRKSHILWMLESENTKVLLEKIETVQ